MRCASGAPPPASGCRRAAAVAFAEKRSLNAAITSACCGEKPSTRTASRTALRPRQAMVCEHITWREAEYTHRVAHRAPAAPGDVLADHRRVLAAVPLVHVL